MNQPAPTPAPARPPETIHVLAGATEMPFVSLDSLPAAVRTLALSGAVVVVAHDEQCQRLMFHRQETWIPSGEPPDDERAVDDDSDKREPNAEWPAPHAVHGPMSEAATTEPGPEWARPGDYEEEGSDRTSRGFLWVGARSWWTAEITVPMHGDESALLKLERHSTGPVLGPEDATFVVPPGEADDLLALLTGLFAQARRDGVLTDTLNDRMDATEELKLAAD